VLEVPFQHPTMDMTHQPLIREVLKIPPIFAERFTCTHAVLVYSRVGNLGLNEDEFIAQSFEMGVVKAWEIAIATD